MLKKMMIAAKKKKIYSNKMQLFDWSEEEECFFFNKKTGRAQSPKTPHYQINQSISVN